MRISGLMKEYMVSSQFKTMYLPIACIYFIQTDLHFTAPDKPGHFRYNVVLRSDSYLDLFFSQDIKVRSFSLPL